jgi:hypothetical protein
MFCEAALIGASSSVDTAASQNEMPVLLGQTGGQVMGRLRRDRLSARLLWEAPDSGGFSGSLQQAPARRVRPAGRDG